MKNLQSLLLGILFVAIQFINTALAQNHYRDSWQQPEKIMDILNIKPGMIIGEAGAGNGYFTFHLSKRVGESGKVYANDIDENALKEIELKCKKDTINNITTIIGKVADPLFPQNKLDLVIMLRAFHDFTQPVQWMKNVKQCMKPGAQLVIIDYDPDRTGYNKDHFLTKDQLLIIMKKTDFKLVRIESFLSRDNIYIFKLNDYY